MNKAYEKCSIHEKVFVDMELLGKLQNSSELKALRSIIYFSKEAQVDKLPIGFKRQLSKMCGMSYVAFQKAIQGLIACGFLTPKYKDENLLWYEINTSFVQTQAAGA